MRKNFGVKTWIYPQPVLMIATYNENGTVNVMNAAWGGIGDSDKVVIDLGEHKTTDNIARRRAFTVSCGDIEHVIACDYLGIVSGKKVPNKFEKAGLTATKSEFVDAPVINELPVSLECELLKIEEDGRYIGKILNVSCDEKFLGPDGLPDLSKFTPISYDPVHHGYIALGEKVGQAFADGKKLPNTYKQISQPEAKQIMDTRQDILILDVREKDEFDSSHIPGAIQMSYLQTEELAAGLLPDKGQLILVYCRSGRRSKIAAEALVNMGYTDIQEFGGIIDWPYETT